MDVADDTPAQLRKAPVERAVRAMPLACGGVWTAVEIMHLTGVPWLDITLGTTAVATIGYGKVRHKAEGRSAEARQKARRHARHVAGGIMMTGGWMATASRFGPLDGPYCAMSLTWIGASLAGWFWARRHEVVTEARDWRNTRTGWLSDSKRWGLGGSHLLHHERTRLGERMIANVKGTGKRASQHSHHDIAERIAEERNLPPGRVLVKPHRLAGRIEISIRETDPWEKPIPHPVLADDPELDLAVPCSIRKPVEVGQDPETGKPLLLPLWDERGGKNISVVGLKGAGKTVLLNNASERVTAASDALLIRVNLSIKGLAEARRWGPACHLTAFGTKQSARALRVLRTISKVIEWRSQQDYDTDVFVPSPGDPQLVLIMDEVDAATQYQAIRIELENIASKGREYGVTLLRAGQRGTAEWTGGANVRANDDVFCIGMVNRRGEMMHAAGDLGLSLPDMASYGDGHGGVWVIAELGGSHAAGRTFMLKNPPDIMKIVAERASRQPNLKPELEAFLGDSYANLLRTDIYATRAREQAGEPVPVIAAPRPDAMPQDAPGTEPAPAAVATAMNPLDVLDNEAEEYMDTLGDDDLRTRLRRMGEKNDATRAMIAETVAMPEPVISHEDQVAHAAMRWQQLGEATEIPDDARAKLLELLAAGTSIGKAAEALGVTRWVARTYLERLRTEGLTAIEGSGRSARWVAVHPSGGDAK